MIKHKEIWQNHLRQGLRRRLVPLQIRGSNGRQDLEDRFDLIMNLVLLIGHGHFRRFELVDGNESRGVPPFPSPIFHLRPVFICAHDRPTSLVRLYGRGEELPPRATAHRFGRPKVAFSHRLHCQPRLVVRPEAAHICMAWAGCAVSIDTADRWHGLGKFHPHRREHAHSSSCRIRTCTPE